MLALKSRAGYCSNDKGAPRSKGGQLRNAPMKQRRSLLAWGIVALVSIALWGGCANGGSTQGGTDDAGESDATRSYDATSDALMCTGGRVMCGGTCTNPMTDSMNCGVCKNACPAAHTCMGGQCVFGCASGETLCGGPSEAGAPEGGSEAGVEGGSDEGGSAEAGEGAEGGSLEAGEDDGGEEGGAGMDAAPDAGAAYYCANTSNDPQNCGGCGISCGPNRTCMDGQCSALTCGAGMVGCNSSGTCIPSGTCCETGDCAVTGEICPSPGGTCACPTGESACTNGTFAQCITSLACCSASDCPVKGQSCPVPGQPCKCDPMYQCCVPTDCPMEQNVGTYTCTNNTCGIGACTMGCFDLNNMFADGCECCNDSYGKQCSTPTSGGNLSVGGAKLSYSGTIPEPTGGDWFNVTFTNTSDTAFHALIDLTTNPNKEFVFDVVSGCSSGATQLPCQDGGDCQAKVQWEVSYMGPNPAADPNSKSPSGASNFQPIPAIGSVYIHVYRANQAAAATCDGYTLEISE